MSHPSQDHTEFPPIAKLIPHSGPLVLLERIVEADDESLTATLQVSADGLYNHGDTVPAWVGMEYMAQAVAAFAGLEPYRRGETIPLGFLLGSRRMNISGPDFPVGTRLTVTVRRILQDDGGMAVFECDLKGETLAASARLNLYQPTDSDQFLRDHHE